MAHGGGLVRLSGGRGAFAPRLQEVFEREFVTGNTREAQQAADAIAEEFAQRSAFQQQLVFNSDSYRIDDAEYARAAGDVIDRVVDSEYVTKASSWFSSEQAAYTTPDHVTTYAVLDLRSTTRTDAMTAAGKIIDLIDTIDTPDWLQKYVTGTEAVHADLTTGSQESLSQAERVGLPLALVVLIGVFGALVAALCRSRWAWSALSLRWPWRSSSARWMNLSVFLETFVTTPSGPTVTGRNPKR